MTNPERCSKCAAELPYETSSLATITHLMKQRDQAYLQLNLLFAVLGREPPYPLSSNPELRALVARVLYELEPI